MRFQELITPILKQIAYHIISDDVAYLARHAPSVAYPLRDLSIGGINPVSDI